MATPFQLTRTFARSLGLRVPVSITSLAGLRQAYSAGALKVVRSWPSAGRGGRSATVARMFQSAAAVGVGRDDAVKMARAAQPKLSWAEGRSEWGGAAAGVRAYQKVQAADPEYPLPPRAHVTGEETMTDKYSYVQRITFQHPVTGEVADEYGTVVSRVPLSVDQLAVAAAEFSGIRSGPAADWEFQGSETVKAKVRPALD